MNQTKKNKKTVWQQYVGIAFMVLCGAICGIIMVCYVDQSADLPLSEKILSYTVLFLGLYAASFFHMILHETGHLVFGLLTGYRFSSFRIASYLWIKENGKLRRKRLSIAGTGGQCLMTPPDKRDGKFPIVLYNLGGSIINTIIGVLFLLVYFLFTDIPFLSPLLLLFAIMGLITAMINGIPMRMGMIDNDGYNVLAISRSKEAFDAFWVQLKVVEQTSKGVRLKDMPSEWFAMPADEALKNSMTAIRGVLACNRLMDEEKFDEADARMAHLLEIDSGIVGLHRNLLICDRVFVELIGENRREVIENMLTKEQKKFMKTMKRFPSVLRTQYALALLFENDPVKAEVTRNEFEKAAKTYPYPHEIDSERDLIRLAETVNQRRREI